MATIVSTRTPAASKKPKRSDRIDSAVDAESRLDTTTGLLRELHLTRPDGSRCFENAEDSAAAKARREKLLAAVRKDGSAQLTSVARRVDKRDARSAAETKGAITPAVSFHSEELRTSVLQTDWSASAAQLALDWSRSEVRCELTVGSDRLIAGMLPLRAQLNGRQLAAAGAWEEVCWDSDPDADYLELEIPLERGMRLQRQFLLTRRDGLLLIADALLGCEPADLAIELTLPAAESTLFAGEVETSEGRVLTGRRRRLIVPLGISEWASDRRRGELTASEESVTLRQTARQAAALYAPLCLVLDPRRAGRAVTWRQLTIGENLQIQSADRAVGYRVQLGKEQWLIYRSLTARANRTLLGVNLQTNFLFGRFLRNGEVERLMEIED